MNQEKASFVMTVTSRAETDAAISVKSSRTGSALKIKDVSGCKIPF